MGGAYSMYEGDEKFVQNIRWRKLKGKYHRGNLSADGRKIL
jgi:hypothetical protein